MNVSHHFQATADSSSGIIFKPDIFDCDIEQTKNGSNMQSLPLIQNQHQKVNWGQVSTSPMSKGVIIKAGINKENQHVIFEIPQMKW